MLVFKTKQAEKACVDNEISMTNAVMTVNQQDYLKEHHLAKNGSIEEQCWAKANIKKFHKSVQFSVSRCTICQEAWPLTSKPRSPNDYVCSRCSRDKKSPKKFSFESGLYHNGQIAFILCLQQQNVVKVCLFFYV